MSENGERQDSSQPSYVQSALSLGDSPVRTYRWLAAAKDWLETEADSGSSSIAFLESLARDGLSSRTSPAFCPPMRGETLQHCLADLPMEYREFLTMDGARLGLSEEAGTAPRGECWTLNISASPSDAVRCSLSQVLEMDVAPRYFLSPRAARGILRRAKERGRNLPPLLKRALTELASKQ